MIKERSIIYLGYDIILQHLETKLYVCQIEIYCIISDRQVLHRRNKKLCEEFIIMTFEEENRALEEQRRRLERERQEFTRRVEIEDRRLEQQQRLVDMKFHILEEELTKLANEKRYVEKQKEFYNRINDFEQKNSKKSKTNDFEKENNNKSKTNDFVAGELFFCGVGNEQSLKKRYKDLIKIYHPDNINGDNHVIQVINKEYDQLKKIFA